MSSIEQKVQSAIADFHDSIAEGVEISAAFQEASKANSLKPGVLEQRLSKTMPIEDLVSRIRHEADHDHFLAVAKTEVAKCKKPEGAYKCMRFLGSGAEAQIIQSVEAALGRSITEGETWIIEEFWDPWIFELKLKIKFGIEMVHKRPLGID